MRSKYVKEFFDKLKITEIKNQIVVYKINTHNYKLKYSPEQHACVIVCYICRMAYTSPVRNGRAPKGDWPIHDLVT